MSTSEEPCGASPRAVARVNDLRGYIIHDGYLGSDGCDVVLVGGKLTDVTPVGVVLRSRNGGRTLQTARTFPQALHVRAIVKSGEAVWIGGDTKRGAPLLLRATQDLRRWEPVDVPRRFTDVTAIAAPEKLVAIAVMTRQRNAAVLMSESQGKAWREVVNVRGSAGQSAYIYRVVIRGSSVLAVGTDGVRAAIFLSRDSGRTFSRVVLRGVHGAASGAILSPSRIEVGGYSARRGTVESGVGVVATSRDGGKRWRTTSLPGYGQVLDLRFERDGRGFALVASPRGHLVLTSARPDARWRPRWFENRRSRPIFERFLPGDPRYLVGESGLYRLP
jgi:hypothetical protein